jgi:hypothetical protein
VLLPECDEFRRRVLPLLGGSDARRGAGLLDDIVGRDSTFDFEPTLVHADLGPDHILCTTSAISGVIDWGDVRIGDPAIDLSWLMNSLPPAMRKAIGEAYGSVAGDALTARAVNWHRLGPWHEVIYGLDVGRPEFVDRGLAGVRDRLPP